MIVEMDIWNPEFLKIAGDFAGKIAGKIAYMLPPSNFRNLPKYQSYNVVRESKDNENCIGVIYKLCMSKT
jgi:hypothetical protein